MPIVRHVFYSYFELRVRVVVCFRKNLAEYAAEFPHSNRIFHEENFGDWKGGRTGRSTRIQHLVDTSDGEQITIEEGIARLKAVGYDPSGICEIVACKRDTDELWRLGVTEIIAGAEYSWRKIDPQIIYSEARVPIVPSLVLDPKAFGLHLHDARTHVGTRHDRTRKIKVGQYFAAYPDKHHPHLHEI